jgi:hypothetical protein
MKQQLVFLDTEFTGLAQRWPRLISIGLVTEDGSREFYAELTPEGYLEKITPWVRENVLPLLDGGRHVVHPRDLCRQLGEWIADLGPVRLVGDMGITTDIKFVESMLTPWPPNLDRRPQFIQFDTPASERFTLAVENAFAGGLRQHHALDDAKAIRLGWIAAGGDIERKTT